MEVHLSSSILTVRFQSIARSVAGTICMKDASISLLPAQFSPFFKNFVISSSTCIMKFLGIHYEQIVFAAFNLPLTRICNLISWDFNSLPIVLKNFNFCGIEKLKRAIYTWFLFAALGIFVKYKLLHFSKRKLLLGSTFAYIQIPVSAAISKAT